MTWCYRGSKLMILREYHASDGSYHQIEAFNYDDMDWKIWVIEDGIRHKLLQNKRFRIFSQIKESKGNRNSICRQLGKKVQEGICRIFRKLG